MVVRHMAMALGAGDCIEVTCIAPGARDGVLMGYAIRFGNAWDGWLMQPHDHQTMVVAKRVCSKADAIAAIAEQWNPGF